MGELEKAVRVKIRRTRINSVIIKTIAIAGLLSVAVLAPNALQFFKQFGLIPHRLSKRRIETALNRLIAEGYVRRVHDGKNKHLELTSKGETFAALLGEGRLAIKKPKRWDGKWRFLIFDIPEKRKRVREQIRLTLVGLGFIRLQDSVWVYPYDCEDLLALLKADFRIGKNLLYVIVDKMEGDSGLKKTFGILEK